MGTNADATTLQGAMARYLSLLEKHREEIDSLNVFPVPDGDTGTNMLMTQRAVVQALEEADPAAGPLGIGDVISRAALMGARGNSGVILSQILRGFCRRWCAIPSEDAEPRRLDGRDLAEALAWAQEEAWAAVARPVEGTILSVVRDSAEAAKRRSGETDELEEVAATALAAAKESLERTPERLPELRSAGVVDAGGKGLVLLLDALASTIRGEEPSVEVGPMGPVGRSEDGVPGLTEQRYGFEVMYLYEGPEMDIPHVKKRLTEVGDSVVVVGGGGLYNVHVHTDDAGAAVEAGLMTGRPRDIRITSLDRQVAESCLAGRLRETQVGDDAWHPPPDAPASLQGDQSVVAVADGDGLVGILESLGAIVVRGGPGNNPSVRQLVEAIERAPGAVVHLLPNHENVIPAAEAAAREASKQVNLLRTRSVPQGISTALAFNPEEEYGNNHGSMLAASSECCYGEIAYAEKAATWEGGEIAPGDCLGMCGGDIRVVGPDPVAVAVSLCRKLGVSSESDICCELITLYAGDEATDDDAERVAAALGEAFPGHEVEVQRGGQPRYPYLIGVE